MRNILPEWYLPDEPQIAHLLTTATIALDANVLLDLYRVSYDQREQILKLLSKDDVRARVWLPYQAALEYQRNRLTVAQDHATQYQAVRKAVNDLPNALTKAAASVRDKAVRIELLALVEKTIEGAQGPLLEAVNRLAEANVLVTGDIVSVDPIRERIDQILAEEDQVGPKPDDAEIDKRRSEAKVRNEEKIPPGYADHDRKSDPSGDLLIWREILDRAAHHTNKPIVLVTSDVKDDWYLKTDKRPLGPRPELVAEFVATPNTETYHQMPLDSFLFYANKYLDAGVDNETIQSVESLAAARITTAAQRAAIHAQYENAGHRLGRARARMDQGDSRFEFVNRATAMLAGHLDFDPYEFSLGITAADNFNRDFSAEQPTRRETAFDRALRKQQAGSEPNSIAELLRGARSDDYRAGDWPSLLTSQNASASDGFLAAIRTLRHSDPPAYEALLNNPPRDLLSWFQQRIDGAAEVDQRPAPPNESPGQEDSSNEN